MENNSAIRNLTAFVIKKRNKIKLLERISIVILAVGLVLNYLEKTELDFVLLIGLLMMALVYFLFAYDLILPNNLKTNSVFSSLGFINFIYKLTYLTFCASLIALLGLVIEIRNNPLILITSATLIIILILSFITKFMNKSNIYDLIFHLRVVIFLMLLGYLASIEYNIKL